MPRPLGRDALAGALQSFTTMSTLAHPTSSGELVLEFHGTHVETEDELVEIEDALVEMLGPDEAIAGRDVAIHARSIAIATPDAAATWQRVRGFLDRAGLMASVQAGTRTNAGEAPVRLWPPDAERAR